MHVGRDHTIILIQLEPIPLRANLQRKVINIANVYEEKVPK